ncbi:tetratricopeptide repeat protein [Kitasatospora sp. NPDC048194]|uniref:tetratricopeptide repeat protein n=1 Tax=Kitasatospora sp. NPDC048194 TaxID=3364045 RepID=UPI003710208F
MIRRRPAGPAISPPSGMEPGAPEEALPPASRPLRAALQQGRIALAEQLAQELQHELAAAHGAEHPEVLQVVEARAYLAHLAGRQGEAARLYQDAAAGWARTGSPRCWPATLCAQACEQLAAEPVRPPVAGRADLVLQRGRVAARAAAQAAGPAVHRGTLVLLLAATSVVFAAVGLAAEPGSEQTAGPALELTTSVVGQALQHGQPSSAPTPAPPPVPVASLTAEPPSEQPDDQDPADAGAAEAPPAGRPSHRPRPARPMSPAGPSAPSRSQPQPAEPPQLADPCAAAREYGHLPDSVIAMCHQAYGR